MVGLNLLVDVWGIGESTDDVIGGAQITGTQRYQNVHARMEDLLIPQIEVAQGLETIKTYQVILRPQSLIIRERDEIVVVKPTNHPIVGQRLRVVGVQRDSVHPSDLRGHIELLCTQVEVSRGATP